MVGVTQRHMLAKIHGAVQLKLMKSANFIFVSYTLSEVIKNNQVLFV
jgi:hypothetical protein